MLGQLSWEVQSHSRLHFPTGDGVFLVVVSQSGGLAGNPLKDIVHKRVHDAHGLGGDASVWVHLLQHLVDVDGVRLLTGLSPLLLLCSWLLLTSHWRRGFLPSFGGCSFGWHCSTLRMQDFGIFTVLSSVARGPQKRSGHVAKKLTGTTTGSGKYINYTVMVAKTAASFGWHIFAIIGPTCAKVAFVLWLAMVCPRQM